MDKTTIANLETFINQMSADVYNPQFNLIVMNAFVTILNGWKEEKKIGKV